MSSSGIFVSQDTIGGGEHQMSELTGWQDLGGPLLKLVDLNVESWRDDSALVQSAQQFDDDLARSVVIDVLELADVA